jgi:drug/metabolite transporter (DMT)-like permease
MISGAFLFATMGSITHALAPRCDWPTIVVIRAVFMFVAAVIVARAAGATLVVWRPRSLWMRSLAGSFSLVCSFYALTRELPVGDVLTLTNTYPIWIVALSWVTLRRTPEIGDVLGVLSGLAGVFLIGRPHFQGENLPAAVVALAGSFGTAVAMIGLHRLRSVDPRAVVAHFAGVASLIVGGWFLARGGPEPWSRGTSVDPLTVVMLLAVATTGTVGQVFLTKAYAAGLPTRISVLGLTQVVFGLAFDVLLWDRTLSPTSLAGSALVLAPAAWLIARGRSNGL